MTIKLALKDLNEVLETKFPNVKLVSHQAKEPVIRPSFVTILGNNIKIDEIGTLRRRYSVPIDLIYFSSDKNHNKIENLDMIESLKSILNIRLNGSKYEIIEPEFDIVDEVLHSTFSLSWLSDSPEDQSVPSYMMEELYVREK